MTLLREDSYKIIQKLNDDGIKTELIVLQADYKTIYERILRRGEDKNCWCIQNIKLSMDGTARLPGFSVCTTDVSVDDLVQVVFNKLGINC